MKKIICFITVLAMVCGIATSAFATVTSVSETRTEVGLLTNGTTKVDKNKGIIDETNGTVLNVSKESPAEYFFKSGDYSYSLLDKDTDGNYFILSADRYGKFSLNSTAMNNIFDPTPGETDSSHASDLNLAVFLNTDFLNGTSVSGTMTANNSKTAIDSAIKNYIVTHDWVIEGNNQDADETKHLTAVTKTDYSVNCKIALLSWSEYIKYSDKIGYASTQYVDNNMTATTTSVLRSPNNSATSLYHFKESDGSISGSLNVTTKAAPTTAYLRPCFYVSEDYFKNTHLTDIGSEVKNILKDFTDEELKTAGYDDTEIADIKGTGDDTPDVPDESTYKSGFVITDDMENGIDNWVKKQLATQEASADAVAYPESSSDNKAMSIGYNTYVYRQLTSPAESGILTLEADIDVNGGNFGIGIIESGKSNIQGKAYPVFIGNNQTKLSAIIDKSASKYDVSDESIASHYSSYNDGYMTFSNEQLFHLKLIIDAKTGECSVMIGDKLSKTIDIPYLGTDTEGNAAIGGITFMNRQGSETASNPAYVDNVKISYDPDGSVVSNIFTGGGKIIASYREDVTVENELTASDVVLKSYDGTALTVASASKAEDGSLILRTSDTMTDGSVYYLSIPALEDEYPITQTSFTYTDEEFTANVEITDEKYTQGETAKAACKINTTEFTAKKVILYLAAYKDNRMTDVTMKEIDISENAFGEITDTAELGLTEDADCIRAFIWNVNQVPYNHKAEKTKAN